MTPSDQKRLLADVEAFCQEIRPIEELCYVEHRFNDQVIPLAKKYSLDELRRTIVELNRLTRSTVMIEYLMLAGVNDALHDARELSAWLDGLSVHVNLIPFNSIEDAPHLVSTDRMGRDSFASLLKAAGLKTTIRYSLGNDIAAACGQLVRVGGLHNQRAHTAHLLVQQANRVGLDIVRTEGVGADKLGESSGLVRLGQARGPHLVQHH